MSGYNNYSEMDEEDNFVQNNGGGGLRKMLEEALAENKKLLSRLDKQDRVGNATAALKEKGLDPALVDLIPQEEDPKAWIEKYAHLLGAKSPVQEESAGEPVIEAATDSDPAVQLEQQNHAAEQQALADMQDAAESGSPAAISSDVLERMNKITSEEELMKFFQSNGAVGG